MKTVLITGSYPPLLDGVGDYAQRVYHALKRHIAPKDLVLITSCNTDPVDECPGIHYCVPNWRLSGVISLMRRLVRERPDVVNIQYPANGYGSSLAVFFLPWLIRLLLPQARVVATLHEYSSRTWKGKCRLLAPLPACHRIIAVTPGYAPEIARILPHVARRTVYIPIGANLLPQAVDDEAAAAARRRLGIDAQCDLLTFFGIVRPGKGLDVLLRAVARAQESRRRSIALLMIGGIDVAYRQSVIDPLLAQLKMQDSVILAGKCTEQELSEYFAVTDVCVLPFADGVSTRRGSFMAALQHGLPIITTKPLHPFPELQAGENVVLVERGDESALAAAVGRLLDHPAERDRLRARVRALQERFSWHHVVNQIARVLFDNELHGLSIGDANASLSGGAKQSVPVAWGQEVHRCA